MAVRFLESGGQYHVSNGQGPGVWGPGANPGSGVVAIASRNGSPWGYGWNQNLITPLLTASGFSGMIAGCAMFFAGSFVNTTAIINFQDNNGVNQCELRINTSGQVYFTRNGVNLGAGNPTLSTLTIPVSVWNYIEFKALFSTTGTGTCEVRVNGTTYLTLTNVTNAANASGGFKVNFFTQNQTNSDAMDFYVLDTTSGLQQNYLGDITVAEYYDNGPGVNAAWSVNQPAFVLTQVANASGGTTVYTGTITNGATPANAWQGYYFTVSGFVNGANNGTFLCSASTAATITLVNAAGVSETHAGSCAFQAPLQAGIHGGIVDGYQTTNVGIRPPNENQYVVSNTPGQLYDQAHQTVNFVGSIAAVVQMNQARRDDAGARSFAQFCLSAGTEQDGVTQSLPATDNYFATVYETDPHTGAQWTQANLNAATFGVKEIA